MGTAYRFRRTTRAPSQIARQTFFPPGHNPARPQRCCGLQWDRRSRRLSVQENGDCLPISKNDTRTVSNSSPKSAGCPHFSKRPDHSGRKQLGAIPPDHNPACSEAMLRVAVSVCGARTHTCRFDTHVDARLLWRVYQWDRRSHRLPVSHANGTPRNASKV
jgi:hypothetical protein